MLSDHILLFNLVLLQVIFAHVDVFHVPVMDRDRSIRLPNDVLNPIMHVGEFSF